MDDRIEAKTRQWSRMPKPNNPNVAIQCPLNPEEIRIKTTYVSVEQIVSQIGNGEIYWDSDIQHSFAWQPEQQSRFIESLLLRIPIPAFYVAVDKNNNWSVVDGVQRLSAIYNYFTGEFSLHRLEYFVQLNGKSYCDLSRPMQRRINETQLVLHIVEADMCEDVRLNICRRIIPGRFNNEGQLFSSKHQKLPARVRCCHSFRSEKMA